MFISFVQVFGYVTNTNIKFIVVVDASNATLRDNEIRFVEQKNGFGANVKNVNVARPLYFKIQQNDIKRTFNST